MLKDPDDCADSPCSRYDADAVCVDGFGMSSSSILSQPDTGSDVYNNWCIFQASTAASAPLVMKSAKDWIITWSLDFHHGSQHVLNLCLSQVYRLVATARAL